MTLKLPSNNPLEVDEIRKLYKSVEVRLLIMLGLSLPVFGIVYLYYNSGNLNWNLPILPKSMEFGLIAMGFLLLLTQWFLYKKKFRSVFKVKDLYKKMFIYSQASLQRIHILTISCFLDAAGLLLFKNPLFVVFFAVTLVFFSLAKPTPDRIIRTMKLDKSSGDLIRQASRPEEK